MLTNIYEAEYNGFTCPCYQISHAFKSGWKPHRLPQFQGIQAVHNILLTKKKKEQAVKHINAIFQGTKTALPANLSRDMAGTRLQVVTIDHLTFG